jgi:Rrf2 family protein
MFSKACEYGLRAVIYIAEQSAQNNRAGVKDIARAIDSPAAFTAKVLNKLAKRRLIRSVKGPKGGYEMDEEKRKRVNIAQIVTAIDGERIYQSCGLGLKECDEERPCPLHHKFIGIKDGLNEMLTGTTIEELGQKLREDGICLKR